MITTYAVRLPDGTVDARGTTEAARQLGVQYPALQTLLRLTWAGVDCSADPLWQRIHDTYPMLLSPAEFSPADCRAWEDQQRTREVAHA